MTDLTFDEIEAIKARDDRVRLFSEAIAVETDLRDNPTIRALMTAIRTDADQAMETLAETSPEDRLSITLLLVKIRTLVYVRRALDDVLRRGQAAEQALRAEDAVMADE